MLAVGHDRPCHPGDLVGKGDGGDLGVAPRQQCCEPGPVLGAMDLGIADDGSLPPLECCFGTSPIQAEKLRPDRKVLGSATLATSAVANIGPTPGM